MGFGVGPRADAVCPMRDVSPLQGEDHWFESSSARNNRTLGVTGFVIDGMHNRHYVRLTSVDTGAARGAEQQPAVSESSGSDTAVHVPICELLVVVAVLAGAVSLSCCHSGSSILRPPLLGSIDSTDAEGDRQGNSGAGDDDLDDIFSEIHLK